MLPQAVDRQYRHAFQRSEGKAAMERTFATLNPLPDPVRNEMIDLLNLRMADILDLHYQTLLAHWNVRGANFIGLHKFFEEFAGCNGAENWCDWVAERISQLGGVVVTTVHYIASHTSLDKYPIDIASGDAHINQLTAALVKIISAFRDAARRAETIEDYVSCDILRQVQRSAEKYLWLLEAHIQDADSRIPPKAVS